MNNQDYESYQKERLAFWRHFRTAQCVGRSLGELADFFGGRLEEYVKNGELLYDNGDYCFPAQRRRDRTKRGDRDRELVPKQLDAYAGKLLDAIESDSYRMLLKPGESIQTCFARLIEKDGEYSAYAARLPAEAASQARRYLYARIEQDKYRLTRMVTDELRARYPAGELKRLIEANNNYRETCRRLEGEYRRKAEILGQMTEMAPIDPRLLYLDAMRMERRIFLHVGGTNAGKSFEAIRALASAKSGVYLAPLRLLAYEVYDTLTKEGISCAMITGEERIMPEGRPTHVSSTIEMLDMDREVEVAVIDEAQMISDRSRGGAWTKAVLGVKAREIHVCAAPYAEKLLTGIFASCGNEVSVIRHERKVPLVVEKEEFLFPESVRDGDACIVFSRRDALAAAAELQDRKIPCSIIYGAMPYDVRHAEMARFSEGKGRSRTRVIVATDAIGMGLNVPIRRVVFLSTEKYDGFEERRLKAEEIQQIAGRAGRYGMYDIGLVTSWGRRRMIREGLAAECDDLTEAVLPFPSEVIDCDAPLSELLSLWSENPVEPPYVKSSVEHELKLCRYMERLTKDKHLIYRYITLPFDEDSDILFDIWARLLAWELNIEPAPRTEDRKGYRGKKYDSQAMRKGKGRRRMALEDFVPPYPEKISTEDELKKCETAYQACDLLYQWGSKQASPPNIAVLIRLRSSISQSIMQFLRQQKLRMRRCRICGAKLPFGTRSSICDNCAGTRWN